ncbi:uncharacterized protein BXZ73DRAFT_80274 [Epithele typhae]|uniref:uncharacterized protein n=1 Tax=Epithele typhae TaxID=378194 RepID=UPI0020089DF5|nr:uncharacterized protein BXZ73DRAFT_80274 [Epithele typhae]KAH9919757.1 hypothetical protein BXZ73DRAFT_80274 [Epithele typhae]
MSMKDLGDQVSQVIEEYQDLYSNDYVPIAAADVSLMLNMINFLELKFMYNSCTTLDNTVFVLEYMQPLPPAAFSAMRALALSQSRPLAILVLVFSIMNVGLNFGVLAYRMQSFSDPIFGCVVTYLPIPRPFLVSVFLILNTLRMATTLRGIISPIQISLIGSFGDPLTTILVSRFLLDLQEVHQRTIKLGSDDPLHSSASDCQVGIGSLRFAVDAMGSIRADLRILDNVNGLEEDDYPVAGEETRGRVDVDSTA